MDKLLALFFLKFFFLFIPSTQNLHPFLFPVFSFYYIGTFLKLKNKQNLRKIL